jgi:phosphate transport system substrate-binding protein
MSDAELLAAKGGSVLHIPTALGGVVLSYNLAEVGKPLRLTGALVSDIFRGKVTKWNDAAIAAGNPGVELPARDIVVVHRSDGSGTTFVFTDYLSQVSSDWSTGPGRGKDVAWPTGVGAKGNDGVASQIKSTPGAIGYVELTFARQNSLPTAWIQNASGLFMDASVSSINAAATTLAANFSPTSDYRVSVVNAPGPDAYPIASFTWAIIYRNPSNPEKAKKVVDFLRWGLTRGQQYEAALNYAPLPSSMVKQLLQRLDSVQGAKK